MLCSNCKKENSDDELFCQHCGHILPKPTNNDIYPHKNIKHTPDYNYDDNLDDTSEFYYNKNDNYKTDYPKKYKSKKNISSPFNKSKKIKYKKVKPKKQKQPRYYNEPTKVVNKTVKKGGCFTAFLALIIMAIIASGIFGLVVVKHYGLDTILSKFGYQLNKIDDTTSTQDTENSKDTSNIVDDNNNSDNSDSNSSISEEISESENSSSSENSENSNNQNDIDTDISN